jgi:hypothetical protein
MQSALPTLPYTRRHGLWLVALGLAYALATLSLWDLGYIDFGDGNYMYIAGRIAQGAVVYRDILAPQPPCHLFLGAAVVKLAAACGAETPLFFFRALSLLLHLIIFALVVALARRAWGRPAAAVLAGAIYLWLPIGFWWALGYQSEPLEIVFLLAMMLAALRETRAGDILAGVCAGLAGLTNATAAPFLLVLIIYMLVRAPRRALRMALPCVVLVGIVTAMLQKWTDGAYLENVVFNQVGTYPSGWQFFPYAWGKLIDQGSKVLAREGVWLILALLGLERFLKSSPLAPAARGGLGWFCLATLGSIIYVTKGGTADYIFSLSEPAVAILGAGEVLALVARLRALEGNRPAGWLALAMLALFAVLPGAALYRMLWTRDMYELPADRAALVRYNIDKLTRPADPILAPPFYAVLAGRRLLGDYSELFIWNISYYNDRRGIGNGQGVKKVAELTAALQARQVPLVILEMDQQGGIPELMQTLRAAYQPLQLDRKNWLFPTLNTRLGAFVPAGDPVAAAAAWRAFETEVRAQYGAIAPRRFTWLTPATPTAE